MINSGRIGILFLGLFISSCVHRSAMQLAARNYQSGRIKEDTSYVYQLPYEEHTCHRVIQGYYSLFTHRYRAAIDFKMKKGTPVCAVRNGIVLRTKDDSNMGGFKKKYRPYANYVVIQHPDSTRSSYRHLQLHSVLCHAGDSVQIGQIIGRSGNTGYTFTPHLHLIISQYQDGNWQSIPCRFVSKKYQGYLHPLKKYESINKVMTLKE